MIRSRLSRWSALLTLSLALAAGAFAQAPTEAPARKAPPYIILKADDLTQTKNGTIHPLWQKFVNTITERNLKASIGIIRNSLEKDNPAYYQWIKDLRATGRFEFWNHGLDHREWQEDGKKLQEFKGTSYEHQKEHMTRANALAREKLGFAFEAFGSPFNSGDENTVKVLEEDKDIKIWLFGNTKNPAGKVVLDRVGVNLEPSTFVPDVEKFKAAYARYPNREVFTLQGHPTHWNEERYAEFVKTLDFLIEQKAVFVTPSEYVRLKQAAPAPTP